MELTINGEHRTFAPGVTLEAILQELKIIDKVMACAVNMEIIKKEAWGGYTPNDKDRVELLHFVGGG